MRFMSLLLGLLVLAANPAFSQSIFDDTPEKQPATSPPTNSAQGMGPIAPASQPDARPLPPIPDAASLKDASSLMHDTYGSDIEAAKTVDQKTAMAQKLVEAAAEEKGANRYVLLSAAKDLAIDAGDIANCDAVIDGLAASFAVDAPKLRLEAYTAIGLKLHTPADEARLCKALSATVCSALAADEFNVAGSAARLESEHAHKTTDAALLKQADDDARIARESETGFAGVKTASDVLTTQPTDTEANLEVGTYRCFIKGDWDSGLRMLAAGSDATLKALAAQEIAGVDATENSVKLGDAWWSVGEKKTGLARENILSHARAWYERALPNLHGLAKAVVEKRLTQIADARRSETPSVAPRRGISKTVSITDDPEAVLAAVRGGRPELFGDDGEPTFIVSMNGSDAHADKKRAEGSYSKQVGSSNNGGGAGLWGLNVQLDPGAYLVVYRIQQPDDQDAQCYFDIVTDSGNRQLAEYHSQSGDFEQGKWMLVPVALKLTESHVAECRVWPNGHAVLLDRVYVYRMD